VHTLKEMAEKAKCWYCPLSVADIDAVAAGKQLTAAVRQPLHVFTGKLEALPDWTLAGVHQAFADTLAELNLAMGKVGPAIRVAITGSTASPSIDHTVYLCGRGVALDRLHKAIGALPQ
jgi:glutamyl-tRNA synthetase